MTQQQIAIEYIKEFGSMIPAKIGGFFYKGHICGSEMSKRCRELRKKGILRSEPEGKFTRYYLNETKETHPQGHEEENRPTLQGRDAENQILPVPNLYILGTTTRYPKPALGTPDNGHQARNTLGF